MAKTILFTGGHHNSALVLALALAKQGHHLAWIGHKFTMRGNKALSAEYQEVTQAGLPFYELKAGKFYHKTNPMEFLKIALGFVQAFIYLLQIRPQLIVSFGGYLSVPVVICGWLLGIPSVTHEQTVTAGWANRAITPFVKQIFLTHSSSLSNYPRHKSLVTGLPIREELLTKVKYPKPKLPLIYITCGKQGSQVINQAVFPVISQLVTKYKVVHQTGVHTRLTDQDKARRTKASLPRHLRSRYLHRPYFFSPDATRYLRTASLVISRAGAHTTYELLLLNKKSLLIPIPWVSHDEQNQNAQLLRHHRLAIVLSEAELTPQTLLASIQQATRLPARRFSRPLVTTDATVRILRALTPYLT